MKRTYRLATLLASITALVAGGVSASADSFSTTTTGAVGQNVASSANLATVFPTKTPIKHLVVIFDENVSFDHYFGTYPFAQNLKGETQFHPSPSTPTVNGLYNNISPNGPTGPLMTNNPNKVPSGAAVGANGNPTRLAPNQVMTCDQNHGYAAEQQAVDGGAMDNFIATTGRSVTLAQCLAGLKDNGSAEPVPSNAASNYAVMDYYDGNTVTGLWNYAQHFAMSQNAYGTNYGPSTDGALNVTSANTYGALCGPSYSTINDASCAAMSTNPNVGALDPNASQFTMTQSLPQISTASLSTSTPGTGTDISDTDPFYDACTYLPNTMGGDGNTNASTIAMSGANIGTDLNSKYVTWGWFEGGFDAGYVPGTGMKVPTIGQVCASSHQNVGGSTVTDYIPHHEPFQYYASTANPYHLPPTSVANVGRTDQANHQYDLADFWAAADQNNLPAVSFLKAPAYQDGHAGYSDPADEQAWLVSTIDHLEALPSWSSTAIVITYDDSDGWYDHVLAPVLSGSQTPGIDSLSGANSCGTNTAIDPVSATGQIEQGKCGLGPRLPFLVISPYSKSNYVDSTVIDQSSVDQFIEYNWGLPAMGNGAADASAGSILGMFSFDGARNTPLFMNPKNGLPVNWPTSTYLAMKP